jgi:hypothetical protein
MRLRGPDICDSQKHLSGETTQNIHISISKSGFFPSLAKATNRLFANLLQDAQRNLLKLVQNLYFSFHGVNSPLTTDTASASGQNLERRGMSPTRRCGQNLTLLPRRHVELNDLRVSKSGFFIEWHPVAVHSEPGMDTRSNEHD